MARETLSPSAYAVLGLLDRTPAAGYELGTIAMRTIAHFWPLTRTHIYNELGRLESLGYVTGIDVAQAGVPDKRVYRITGDGVRALDEWVNDPEVPPERNRIPMLLKLFFGHRMHRDQRTALLARYRERALAERAALAAIVDDLAEHHPEDIYPRATALYGVRQIDAMLAWLAEVEDLARDDGGRPTPRRRGPRRQGS